MTTAAPTAPPTTAVTDTPNFTTDASTATSGATTARPFAHLHCHTHYSLLDGASRIPDLVKRAKAEGMTALAITDHGNLHGAIEFYQACKGGGINPILGYEAYIAPDSRFRRSYERHEETNYHLTLLAQNRTGFKNLIKLASAAFREGFYYKPRIDRELLAAHSEGIICLSGCVSGEFSRMILRGQDPELNIKEACDVAGWFHSIFGDRYFIEIQNNGVDVQRLALEGAVEVAQRVGLPLVATSDAHYVRREDAVAQDVLLCINTGRFRTDTNRMKMEGDQFFLRNPEEMYAAFPGLEDAVARSQQIADTVDIDLELGKRHFPTYDPPAGQTSADYLRATCEAGLLRRYEGDAERIVDGKLAPDVLQRLDRELHVINTLGFANYFLIVWDFVRFAHEQGIPCTARGSGVGSLVAYGLGMSHVCPLRYDLLFERFLDESRKEAPDIDIDFCKDRRAEVIQYVKAKYGEENVAQIGTFGTLAAKAAIRDVARALSLSARADSIVAMIPEELGISLDDALKKSDELRKAYESDADVHELVDLARAIEGLARNVGTHAAGVVIADRPLVEYVPLQQVTGKEEIITQWEMGDVEKAGLLKMDFLGLRNLTILAKAVELIEQTTGERIDPYKFPLDDKETFALLCRGETKGVFQLESGGIRDLLQRMKPDHFHDIIATNALYRPGPLEGGMVDDYIQVKHGRKQPEYKHPRMREVLEETHGVMVYQEQVMRLMNRLGGIELSSAYTCIKAISKKKAEIIDRFREEFYQGSMANGLKRKDAEEIFALIQKFAGYGFNKSHSTAYALVAYMTAYLKAHWPVEFMAALLSGDMSNRNFKRKDPLVEHIEDCRRMEVVVVEPDVNQSHPDFSVKNGRIHFGLAAIKGCGWPAAEAIVRARESGGPFRDLFDFCERVDAAAVNRAAIESLVKAGACDSLGGHRAQLLAAVERALQAGSQAAADRRAGQRGLFDMDDDAGPAASPALPDVPPWDPRQSLSGEKEVLGFYLTSHPLAEHEQQLRTYCTHTTVEAVALAHRTEVLLGGMIASLVTKRTKNPRPGSTATKYAMFDLEDAEGIMRSIVWPEDYARLEPLVQADAILVVRGAIDKRPGSDEANLIVNDLIPLDQLAERMTRGMLIKLDEARHTPKHVDQLYEILRGYPGNCALELVFQMDDGSKLYSECSGMRVAVSSELRSRVDDLLGLGHVKLLAAPLRQPQRNNGNGRNGYGRGGNGNGNGYNRGA